MSTRPAGRPRTRTAAPGTPAAGPRVRRPRCRRTTHSGLRRRQRHIYEQIQSLQLKIKYFKRAKTIFCGGVGGFSGAAGYSQAGETFMVELSQLSQSFAMLTHCSGNFRWQDPSAPEPPARSEQRGFGSEPLLTLEERDGRDQKYTDGNSRVRVSENICVY